MAVYDEVPARKPAIVALYLIRGVANYLKYIHGNYIAFAFWAVAMLLYLPAYDAGFFQDFIDTAWLFKEQSFSEFLNREGIEHKSFYQVTQLLLYGLLSIFGTRPLPWFLLFTLLHAINGYLALRLFFRLLSMLDVRRARQAATLGAFLFIIHPVQAEVLIWKASLHYLTGTMMLLLILRWTLGYINTSKFRYLAQIWILYLISTFTLEIFYLTPAFVMAVLTALRLSGGLDKRRFTEAILRIFVPLVGGWVGHLIIYYLTYGRWVAHYDFELAEAFNASAAGGQYGKYLSHVLLMESLWPQYWRMRLYDVWMMPGVAMTLLAGIVILFLVIILRFRRLSSMAKAMGCIFFMAILSLVLVLPMWFNDFQLLRNDRYFYLPSVFLLMIPALLIFSIGRSRIRLWAGGIYALYCVMGTAQIAQKASISTGIFQSLLRNFQWQREDVVLLLNLPNNYEGIAMLPADDPAPLNKHLSVFGLGTARGRVYAVSSYNMQQPWDGAHVTVLDSLRLKVTLNQWGCWWWWRTQGAHSYETDLFRLEMTDGGHEYILELKERPERMVVLFQRGHEWRKVDLNRIGVEQWY